MTEVFLTVLNMSLTASYAILFILLIRLPLKKAPKTVSCALWAIAAFRLVCPISFESGFSLLPVNAAPIPQDIVYQQTPRIDSGISSVDSFISRALPAPAGVASVNPLQVYAWLGAFVWLLGIAAMLAYSVVSVLVLRNRLKSARHIERNIYEAANLQTPFVLGLFRPRIYIPAGLPTEQRDHIVRHEQAHIRRLDHVTKQAAFLILSVHWFNPLVWAAFVLLGADMELACDEKVIGEMGGGVKKAYSASLLALATGRRVISGSPLAFGEGNVKGRIKRILRYRKPAMWAIAAAVTVVALLGAGLLLNPQITAPMKWAKDLAVKDIQSIQLIVQPSAENERYRRYSLGEFADIVGLINQSRGRLVPQPEEGAGGAQAFYITTKDGVTHRYVNDGNRYLIIDGEAYDAGYEWLSRWNYTGNRTVPDYFNDEESHSLPAATASPAATAGAGPGGETEPATILAEPAITYTYDEIQAAKDCVRNYFAETATSRILNDLWYDEDICATYRSSYMRNGQGSINGVSEDNVIVLLCNFTIENDEQFNGYYPDWTMILIRDGAGGQWRVDDQGY